MIRKILFALLIIVVVLALVIASQPSDFRVVRAVTIDAPPSLVFGEVNNLRKWQEWSPWAKLDPKCVTTFEGPESGVGAAFGWSGNDEVGEGKMTIIESDSGETVKYRLDFVKPFAGTSYSDFRLAPEGSKTAVTWGMRGTKSFIMKAVGLFVSCETIMGPQLEKGLAQLKAVSEAAAPRRQ